MTQLYFHLRSQTEGLSPDELGLDCPDVETAYLEADCAVRDMARELLRKCQNPRDYAFEITTAAGDLVLDLPFSETLDCLTSALTRQTEAVEEGRVLGSS